MGAGGDEPERQEPTHYAVELNATVGTEGSIVADKPPVTKVIRVSDGGHGSDSASVVVYDSDGGHGNDNNVVVDGYGESEAIRSRQSAQSADVDRLGVGSIAEALAGRPPGRENEIVVANRLVERLNRDGGQWGPAVAPPPPEGGVDCVSRGPEGLLEIQVTTPETEIWKDLRQTGHVSRASSDAAGLVIAMRESVRRKGHVDGMADMILALDATRAPAYALRSVVAEFRAKHADEASAVGYREVWVVGPTVDLVHRLDIDPPVAPTEPIRWDS